MLPHHGGVDMLDGLVSSSSGLAQSSSCIALLLLLLSSSDIVANSNSTGGQLVSMQPSDDNNAFETTGWLSAESAISNSCQFQLETPETALETLVILETLDAS
mgnify:CR=1 FL=1